MHYTRPILNPDELARHIKARTHRILEEIDIHLARGDLFLGDPNKEKRVEQLLCLYCFYGPSYLAGAAITISSCEGCGVAVHSGSTHCDQFCRACAKTHGICRDCGATLDINHRVQSNRKKNLKSGDKNSGG